MKYLLDVNVLLAGIIVKHPQHTTAFAWLEGKTIVLCPLVELAFLRISTNQKAIGVPMEQARASLLQFCTERKIERIFDDLQPLHSHPKVSEEVTDSYLADLASKHRLRLATFDLGIKHTAVQTISA
jgi:predicted nucleic acid-binding protein